MKENSQIISALKTAIEEWIKNTPSVAHAERNIKKKKSLKSDSEKKKDAIDKDAIDNDD